MMKRILCLVLCLMAVLSGCAVSDTPAPSTTAPVIAPAEVPNFSPEGNFYSENIQVELTAPDNASIYYTTDGTVPTTSSNLYSGSLTIQANETDFPRAHTIKAIAVYPDGKQSDMAVHTYFCSTKISDRFQNIVFSITGDPKDLTKGPDGLFFGENYTLRGDESEREVYVEVWNAEGDLILSQGCGLRIYGGVSRGHKVKSMKLYARNSYAAGKGKFDLDFFATPVEDGSGSIVAEYDKLVLRNGGNDSGYGIIRDELNQRLAADAGYTDYEAVVPAIAYLNGKYYGLFWLHESYCDDYFKNKYPNSNANGEFQVIENMDAEMDTTPDEGKEVYAQEYNDLYQLYANSDLTDDSVYAGLCAAIDVENYLDFFALNIFTGNHDWPCNNFKAYRYYAADGKYYDGVYDGRWRYLPHDMDYTFHIYSQNETSSSFNSIEKVLTNDNKKYSPLFDALMHRADCRERFMAKLKELAEGAYSYDNVVKTFNEMHEERKYELIYFQQVLDGTANKPNANWSEHHRFNNAYNQVRGFAKNRGNYIVKYAENFLSKYE